MRVAAGTGSQIPTCPKCTSKNVWRDGHWTPMFGKPIQRWLCRQCDFRFSDPAEVEAARKLLQQELSVETKELKSGTSLSSKRQICAEEAKNLTETAETQLSVSQREKLKENGIDLVIADYKHFIQKEHLSTT